MKCYGVSATFNYEYMCVKRISANPELEYGMSVHEHVMFVLVMQTSEIKLRLHSALYVANTILL